MARVCVEINLLKPMVDEFWIGIGEETRLQWVIFEKVPKYCLQCFHLGHLEDECYANGNTPKPSWKSGRVEGKDGEDLRVFLNKRNAAGKEEATTPFDEGEGIINRSEGGKQEEDKGDLEGLNGLTVKEMCLGGEGSEDSKREQNQMGSSGPQNLEEEQGSEKTCAVCSKSKIDSASGGYVSIWHQQSGPVSLAGIQGALSLDDTPIARIEASASSNVSKQQVVDPGISEAGVLKQQLDVSKQQVTDPVSAVIVANPNEVLGHQVPIDSGQWGSSPYSAMQQESRD
ncbi:hypothetical protein ZIOFF_050351 [Zingiber officinale]|uniref:Uncharacterized protein n=1 Tax=Zingiber officinale TaxID=94328 RepID=A0A8J5KTL2_ZINOF|nr:hypothetical protein ZIOFF_050351 [Zingiber officinale]